MTRFALRLVELPTRDRKKLRELLRDHEAPVSRALLDACEAAGELNAIVQETQDQERLEAIQKRLAAVGVVTALVERDAPSGWWRGLLGERRQPDAKAPAEIPDVDREKIFQRLQQDEQKRRDAWWHWWLERGAMRLKLLVVLLFLVAGAVASIALTGLLTPVNESGALTQTDEADENGNPLPSARSALPGGGSGNELPETAEQPGSPQPQPGGAGAPEPSAAAAASESDSDKPEPPIARWIGWAMAGVMTGSLAVLMHRLRRQVSTRMARNLRMALWAVTGMMLVFLVLSVVRSQPAGPSPEPMGGSQQEPAPTSASEAPPADEGNSGPSMSLPEWARTLPPPGSFSAMNQQLGVFPGADGEQETSSLASALPPVCEAPTGSFAELACLLRRVPSAALPGAEAPEASAADAAMAATNNEEGSAAQLPGVEGSANNTEAAAADTRPAEGSAAPEGSAEGSSGEPARAASEGTGSQAVAAEASGAPRADEQPAGADDGGQQTETAANNNAVPAEVLPPSEGDENSVQPPDSPSAESAPEAADAGQPDTAAQEDPAAEESAEEPAPAGQAGSIVSFLVGWLLGAAGAWLGTRRRNIG